MGFILSCLCGCNCRDDHSKDDSSVYKAIITDQGYDAKESIPMKIFYAKTDEYAILYDRLQPDMYLATLLIAQYGSLQEFEEMTNTYLTYMLDNSNNGGLFYNLLKNEFFFHQFSSNLSMTYDKIYRNLCDEQPQSSIYVTFLTKDILKNHTISQPFWLESDIYFRERLKKYKLFEATINTNDQIIDKIDTIDTNSSNIDGSNIDGSIDSNTNNNSNSNEIEAKMMGDSKHHSKNRNKKSKNKNNKNSKHKKSSTKHKFYFTDQELFEIFEIFWKIRTEKINSVKLLTCPPCAFNYKTKEQSDSTLM